jgi:hypothetical protein
MRIAQSRRTDRNDFELVAGGRLLRGNYQRSDEENLEFPE